MLLSILVTGMLMHLDSKAANSSGPDFTTLVRDSLIQEGVHRATCRSCGELVLFESRRNIPSKDLPPVMAINTLVYESNNQLHKYWIDGRQGPLLKPFIEIRGQVDGMDDPDVVVYELRVSNHRIEIYLFNVIFVVSGSRGRVEG